MKSILELLFGGKSKGIPVDDTNQIDPYGKIVPLKEVTEGINVIIKPELLDYSGLETGESNTVYRPQTFDEYIGQDIAKGRIKDYINGSILHNEQFPHTLICGSSGQGKTTIAVIIANILNKKCVICTAGELKSEQQFIDKLVEADGGIVFVDEAHRISTKVGTFMLPILEDFKVCGRKIKPFTVIFATTHQGNIAKNLEALIQRFSLQIYLQPYSDKDLFDILTQYQAKKYSASKVSNEIIIRIVKNCRKTPRIGISLLRETIYTGNLDQVLRNNGVIKDGLTINDIAVLNYLLTANGASRQTLAKVLRIELLTFEYVIEPYLMFLDYITIGTKRKITDKGKQFLQELEKQV